MDPGAAIEPSTNARVRYFSARINESAGPVAAQASIEGFREFTTSVPDIVSLANSIPDTLQEAITDRGETLWTLIRHP